MRVRMVRSAEPAIYSSFGTTGSRPEKLPSKNDMHLPETLLNEAFGSSYYI